MFILVHLLKELAFTADSCNLIIKIFLSLALPGETQKRLYFGEFGSLFVFVGVVFVFVSFE